MRLLDPSEIDHEKVWQLILLEGDLKKRWAAGKDTKCRWQIIRDAYSHYLPLIMEAGKIGGAVDPYFLDWDFTPIEQMAWMDIRGMGLPLFPQFPVGRIFIDFADPYRKIGVELDGAAYHDQGRDLERDTKLVAGGWKVFRIKGSVANRIIQNPFEHSDTARNSRDFRDEVIRWAVNDSTGFFWALNEFFYRPRSIHKSLAYDVLSRFQLADFDLEDCE